MSARATPRFRDLPDVDWSSFADGEVPVYNSATGKLEGGAASGGGTPPDASTTVKGIGKLATAPASASNPIAAGDNDPRLSDQRVPTDGSVTDAKVAAGAAIAMAKLALAITNGEVAAGAAIDQSKLALAITNAEVAAGAAIAEAKLNLASDAAAATASRRTLGTGATQAAAGNDSRLSDSRTPTVHKTSHAVGGSDVLSPADIGAALAGAVRATYKAGDWLWPPATVVSGIAPITGRLYVTHIHVPKALTFDRIGCRVSTAATVAGTTRLGIYEDNGSGRPSARILDAGTVSALSTGNKEITISQVLAAGFYWVASQSEFTATLQLTSAANAMPFFPALDQGSNYQTGLSTANTGALPSSLSGVSWTTIPAVPLTSLRVA